MSERIRGSYDDALYKSTYTLLYFSLWYVCFLSILFLLICLLTIFPLIEAGSLIEAGGGLRANTLPNW